MPDFLLGVSSLLEWGPQSEANANPVELSLLIWKWAVLWSGSFLTIFSLCGIIAINKNFILFLNGALEVKIN